jgi:signal peptidase I
MRKLANGLAWTLGTLLVIGLVLRVLVLDVWKIPDDPVLGASIAPTLASGDLVLVLTRGEPTFGEIVRCPDPETPGRHIVGRVAGVSGDVVETDHSSLLVNKTRYDAESACPEPDFMITEPTGREVSLKCDVVAMGSGRHFRAVGRRPPLERPMRTEVRPDTVFLVSDNRSYHDDSRDFGLLPHAGCQRLVFRFWGKSGWSDEAHRLSYLH